MVVVDFYLDCFLGIGVVCVVLLMTMFKVMQAVMGKNERG